MQFQDTRLYELGCWLSALVPGLLILLWYQKMFLPNQFLGILALLALGFSVVVKQPMIRLSVAVTGTVALIYVIFFHIFGLKYENAQLALIFLIILGLCALLWHYFCRKQINPDRYIAVQVVAAASLALALFCSGAAAYEYFISSVGKEHVRLYLFVIYTILTALCLALGIKIRKPLYVSFGLILGAFLMFISQTRMGVEYILIACFILIAMFGVVMHFLYRQPRQTT